MEKLLGKSRKTNAIKLALVWLSG